MIRNIDSGHNACARGSKHTVSIEKHGRWYVAWVEEVPGVNTQGRTWDEVRSNLKEALHDILELNRGLARKTKA